jgi:hypothetical protein
VKPLDPNGPRGLGFVLFVFFVDNVCLNGG